MRDSLLQPLPAINNYMTPFHSILIEDIIVKNQECLGMFTVSAFMKLSQTSKRAYKLIVKHKIIKKLVRLGNLDGIIRI